MCPPGIKDVASLAGVSVGTASNVGAPANCSSPTPMRRFGPRGRGPAQVHRQVEYTPELIVRASSGRGALRRLHPLPTPDTVEGAR